MTGPDLDQRRARRVTVAAMVASALTVAACTTSSASAPTTTAPAAVYGSITVSAASSLTGAFGQLAVAFEHDHPGTAIVFNFGSSGTLATQIDQGAPVDVFASASPAEMTIAQESGRVQGSPVIFARNTLELAVKPGNPLHITSLADLTKAGVVALCATSAPCGAAATEALRSAGVTIPPSKITVGNDVKTTLGQVTTGNADAAIVYVTDARTVGKAASAVAIPAAHNVVTAYPIAEVKGSSSPALDAAWIAFVTGSRGQQVLRATGFLPPR